MFLAMEYELTPLLELKKRYIQYNHLLNESLVEWNIVPLVSENLV